MTVLTTGELAGNAPALIALDWGTSSLRAYLLDARGEVAVWREAPWGILQLPGPPAAGGFDQAFEGVAGDWLARWPDVPVIASGMVGSAQGWREAPYLPCPMDPAVIAGHLVGVETRSGSQVFIAPGVLQLHGRDDGGGERLPDVMRGEEVQIFGALSLHRAWAERACIVLPGTHSKWAWIEAGRIMRFTTSMAGELYSVLRQHSILGRLMAADANPTDPAAFERGVALAYEAAPGKLITLLFSVRSLALSGELPAEALPDYLSGLLIGSELAAMLRGPLTQPDCPLVLVGSATLTQRYVQALAAVGVTPTAVLDNTAPQGLWRIAVSAGLIKNGRKIHVR